MICSLVISDAEAVSAPLHRSVDDRRGSEPIGRDGSGLIKRSGGCLFDECGPPPATVWGPPSDRVHGRITVGSPS